MIDQYKDTINNLKSEKRDWDIKVLAGNTPDRHGIYPAEEQKYLGYKIGIKKEKLSALENKLARLEEKIDGNKAKRFNAKQLVESQAQATNNEPSEDTTIRGQIDQIRAPKY